MLQFYADEAHSINTAPNAKKHIYKLLTRKTCRCFGLTPNFGNVRNSKAGPLASLFKSKADSRGLLNPTSLTFNDEILTETSKKIAGVDEI